VSAWEIVVSAVAAAVAAGGVVTVLVRWFVDKRRKQRERRERIVDAARELVSQGQGMDRSEILLDPRYLAIRPHLDPEVEGELREQRVTVVRDTYGTVGNPYLALIRNEADRLAKKWKLVE
jgi:hypothetical protein